MDKNRILIVAGSILQAPAVTAARELGLRVVVTDRNPSCVCATLANEFYQLDIFDAPGHVALAKSLPDLAAVFTTACDATVTVATVARKTGMHGLPVKVAARCRSKILTRMALHGKVPQPRFIFTGSVHAARRAVGEIGASIVKAVGSSGGRGHTRVASPDAVMDEVFERAAALSRSGNVLVEEMLHGPELSVETLWHDGEMWPLNAVERPFAHRPWELGHYTSYGTNLKPFGVTAEAAAKHTIELGHFNPAKLQPAWIDEVWRVMRAAGDAIGMDEAAGGHILKGDVILPDDGPKVLELTPRLSGNFDSGRTSPLAHGVNYTKGAVKLALGGFPDWKLFTPRWYRHAVCLSKFAQPGTVAEIRGLSEARRRAEVVVKRGVSDEVPELMNYAAQVAYIIADGHLRSEAMGKAMRAMEVLEWITE